MLTLWLTFWRFRNQFINKLMQLLFAKLAVINATRRDENFDNNPNLVATFR